jgi:replicative DNA helicase
MSEPIVARVLPHDLEAERAVLGAILLRPDVFFDVADVLQPDDFYRDAHRRIFRHVHALVELKTAIDGLTLRDSLARTNELEEVGGISYLFSLTDGVPRSTNAPDYARIVREKAQLRQIAHVCQKTLADVFEADQPAADVLDHAQAALFQVADRRAGRSLTDTQTLMPIILETVEKLVADKQNVTGVPTGFSDLDDMTRGLQPSDLIVLAARPSMGKTAFALNMVQSACVKDRRRALIFSLEMSQKSLGLRLLASEARIDHHKLLSGHVTDDDWTRIANALERLGHAGIHIDDSTAATVFDVRATARRLKADGGLDLIVIDYLQLMSGAQKAENKNLEVAGITKGLKAIARDLDVPVLLLSQLSRDPDKRGNHRPQLSDLRDSGAIEQDADVVIFLHREEKYVPTAANRGMAEAILAKQRNGPTGTIKLMFHDHLVRFDNVTPIADVSRTRLADEGSDGKVH